MPTKKKWEHEICSQPAISGTGPQYIGRVIEQEYTHDITGEHARVRTWRIGKCWMGKKEKPGGLGTDRKVRTI